MKRNEDWPEGSRVCWLEGGRVAHGSVLHQTCFRTNVLIDGSVNHAGLEPDSCDLWAEDAPPLHILYTSHRGETLTRRVIPLGVWFGATERHPTPCWLLHAFCLDRQAERDFDLSKVFPSLPEEKWVTMPAKGQAR